MTREDCSIAHRMFLGLSHKAVTAVYRWLMSVACIALAIVTPGVDGVAPNSIWPVLFGISAGALAVAGARPSLWADILSAASMSVTFGARGAALVIAVTTGSPSVVAPVTHLGIILWGMLTATALAWPWLMRPTRMLTSTEP